MTTFQLVLVGLGVVLVLAVALYNWLQERKYRQALHRSLGEPGDEPVLDAAVSGEPAARRIEPRIQLPEEALVEPTAEFVSRRPEAAPDESPAPWAEPAADLGPEAVPAAARSGVSGHAVSRGSPFVVESMGPQAGVGEVACQAAWEAPAAEPAPQPFTQESLLDSATEYIARLRFSHPVATPYAALLDALRHLGKPVRAMGKREDGTWEPLAGPSRGSYTALELGLQLADRSGAASQAQLEAFCRTLYEFAAEHGGAVSCPDLDTGLEQAQALDLFCIEVDALIGLNVVAPDVHPFKLADVHRMAAAAGMSLQPDGTYVLRDARGDALYTLANQADEPFQGPGEPGITHGVTLLFDVPSVADGLAAFDQMAILGNQMASTLGGHLVDDNGKHVSQESLQRIRQRLADAYANMAARGIPAGGERARRLFV